MSKAERRHHYFRLKKSRKDYWNGYLGEHGRKVNTPKNCSCHGCGNQRCHEGPTKKEKLNQLSMDEQIGDSTT